MRMRHFRCRCPKTLPCWFGRPVSDGTLAQYGIPFNVGKWSYALVCLAVLCFVCNVKAHLRNVFYDGTERQREQERRAMKKGKKELYERREHPADHPPYRVPRHDERHRYPLFEREHGETGGGGSYSVRK